MTQPAATTPTAAEPGGRGWPWTVLSLVLCFSGLALVVALMPPPEPVAGAPDIPGAWSYITVFLLIVGDAVIPIFPGETTLNVASTLAAQGSLDLGLVMFAGAAGAVLGDSALYYIARRMRGRVQRQLDVALANDKIQKALNVIGSGAPTLLVFGRYVPGMRFVVNATLGLSGHPYRQFLRWSAVGGVAWSTYCCAVAYLVGTALQGFPLASVVISALASSLAVAVVFIFVYRRWRAQPA